MLRGLLVVGADAPAFDGATANVRLEDCSRLDAPAVLLAETRLERLTRPQCLVGRGETHAAFELEAPDDLQPRGGYALRARVEAGGLPSDGTLYSTERVPVRPGAIEELYRVRVMGRARRSGGGGL